VCHVRGSRELRTGYWWGNLREGGYLEDQGVDEMTIIIDLKK